VAQVSDGTGTLASIGAISTSVTPGTSAAHLGKAEDAAHATGDVGVAMLGVRTDTTSTQPASAAGDYATVAVDAFGGVYVRSDHPNRFTCGLDAVAATLTQCQAAPAAGLALYVTSVLAQSTTTTSGYGHQLRHRHRQRAPVGDGDRALFRSRYRQRSGRRHSGDADPGRYRERALRARDSHQHHDDPDHRLHRSVGGPAMSATEERTPGIMGPVGLAVLAETVRAIEGRVDRTEDKISDTRSALIGIDTRLTTHMALVEARMAVIVRIGWGVLAAVGTVALAVVTYSIPKVVAFLAGGHL
jgi:hypothetical protein